ncbi:MAG: exodeoxyribonuclease V subunit gamma [Acinetobacter radioresistens]
MGIHVIQSQRIDVLVHGVLSTLGQPAVHPLEVLKTQHFVVPTPAIEQWLTQKMAEEQGISANQLFHQRIRGFQWYAYQQVLADKDKVRKANIPRLIMKWRVYQALGPFIEAEKLQLDQQHPLYPIICRIYDTAEGLEPGIIRQLKKQGMLYWVAEQVSSLFSNYMVYRGYCTKKGCTDVCRCPTNWLKAWGQNQPLDIEALFYTTGTEISAFTLNQAHELEGWQRWLWQEVFHEDFELMQEIDAEFWQQLEQEATRKQALKRLPQQLVVFTLLDLPPNQLQFLRRLGQYIDVFILHYNPSQEYWADSVDPVWKKRYDLRVKERFISKNPQATDADIKKFFEDFTLHFNAEVRESRHPLLTRFGKQARDHFSLLSSLSSGEEGQWVDAFVDEFPDNLLGKLQSDILYLAEPQKHRYPLNATDDSIQIHVCHSSLRQLEVLKDQLTYWLSQNSKDQQRRPSDVLVLVPNLKELEPLIRSVFAVAPKYGISSTDSNIFQAATRERQVHLPIKIAGVAQLDASNAWRAVLERIQLVRGRFTLQEFSDWLNLTATQQCYGLDVNRSERMLVLLAAAGFKRGLDARHLQYSLSRHDEDFRFTFKFALDRLALGIAIPDHTIFNETLSFAQVQPSDFELIAKLIEIYQDFDRRRDWLLCHELGERVVVESWLQRLNEDIAEFEQRGVTALKPVREIIHKQIRMLTLANFYSEQEEQNLRGICLPLAYLIEEINTALDAQIEQAEPTGQITFSQIGQIRPLPYRLVVMLNLDSGTFPSRSQRLPFDLMDILRPQLGDRSRLEDDQGAFLDALLLAQENLWLFYNGFDVNDGEVREPSSTLQEFVQHLALIVASEQPDEVIDQKISLNGIEVPRQLQQLYHVHHLQPFDPAGFATEKLIRYQDQWFNVAQHLLQARGQRQPWANIPYPLNTENIQVLHSQQWIQDVIFPARLYLKTLGVENLSSSESTAQHEPLILDGLGRYAIRDFLYQQNSVREPQILMHQLPVGKVAHSTWQISLAEQETLKARLQRYAPEVTPVTQQMWKVSAELHMQINTPQAGMTNWVSMEPSSARAKRRAKVWLEYLLWLAYLNQSEETSRKLQRVVVFSDQTVICVGVCSAEARKLLDPWFNAWQYGQSQPLVLPAALILSVAEKGKKHEWTENEAGQKVINNFDALLKDWNETHQYSSFSATENEAVRLHRDWQFILQEQDATALLEHCCKTFSYELYAPIFEYQRVETT